MKYTLPETVRSTVFKESEQLDGTCAKIEGYDFNKGVNYQELFKSMAVTGFQASNLGDAIQLVNEMVCFYFCLDWVAFFKLILVGQFPSSLKKFGYFSLKFPELE